MEYFSLPTAYFRRAEYIGAEPVERATWMALLSWSCTQENGGRIVGCAGWGDRRWMQTCGVTADEVRSECGLWVWEGDDLIVFGYPQELQDALETRRINGKKGGRPRKEQSENLDENRNETESITETKPNENRTETEPITETKPNEKRNICNVCNVSKEEGDKQGTVNTTPAVESPVRVNGTPHPDLKPDSMSLLTSQVQGLRPGWDVGRLSRQEQVAVAELWRSLGRQALGNDVVETLHRYFAGAPAGASKWDYPPDRLLFAQRANEYIAKAFAWAQSRKPGDTPVRASGGCIAGKLDSMSDEDQAAYLAEMQELKAELHII